MTQHDRLLRYTWRWQDDVSITNGNGITHTLRGRRIEISDGKNAVVMCTCGDAAIAERITDALNRTEPT